MRNAHQHSRRPFWQTASQLAEMGYCERKVLLSHIHGKRVAPTRDIRQRLGTVEHARSFIEAQRQAPQPISDAPTIALRPADSWFGFVRRLLLSAAQRLRLFTQWRR